MNAAAGSGFRLTPQQYDYLIRAIKPERVRQRQGQSHVEAWDIRRTLIRIFGFGGFDIENRGITLVKEIETKQTDRSRWTVVYRVDLRLRIKDPSGNVIAFYDGTATGDAINQPSIGDAHDFALKTADSQALKRCATNLGDQFGLSLYNKGAVGAVVVGSLVRPDTEQPDVTPDDAPAVLGGEMDDQRDGADDRDYGPPVGQGDERNPRRSQEATAEDIAAARSANRATVRQVQEPGVSDAGRKAALMFAQAASRSGDRKKLLGILAQAEKQEIGGVEVQEAISKAEAAVAGIGEPPITLKAWVTACGKYSNANGGLPVWNAAHPQPVQEASA